MALTKIGKEGITGISNASDATFLTATSAEGVTLAGTLAVTGVHTVGNNAIYTSDGGAVTQNLAQGLCKAWAHTSGSGTPAIDDSFNFASVTDIGTGAERFTFTNAMSNINFSTQAIPEHNSVGVTVQQVPDYANTTTTSTVSTVNISGGAQDSSKSIIIHGDLA